MHNTRADRVDWDTMWVAIRAPGNGTRDGTEGQRNGRIAFDLADGIRAGGRARGGGLQPSVCRRAVLRAERAVLRPGAGPAAARAGGAEAPPPTYYPPAQSAPPPTYDPPAQNAPPPTYYPPAQSAPPPGYYAQPQQQAYPQSGGYPPGAYGQPPGVYQPQVVPVRQSAPYKEGPRFGLFLGGIVVPGTDVTAAAGGAMLTFGSKHHGFETRIYGAFYKVEDEDTTTTGSAAFVHGTRWWGVYGLGFGSGFGYSDFNAKTTYGWNDSSAQVMAYVAPEIYVRRQPTFELGPTGRDGHLLPDVARTDTLYAPSFLAAAASRHSAARIRAANASRSASSA